MWKNPPKYISVQMQSGVLYVLSLPHGIELEVCIQLLNPHSRCALVGLIEGWNSQLSNLQLQVKIRLATIEFSRSVAILDIAKLLKGNHGVKLSTKALILRQIVFKIVKWYRLP